jgi:hypothetical protein
MTAVKVKDSLNSFSRFSTLVDMLDFRSLNHPNQTGYTFLSNNGKQKKSITYNQLKNFSVAGIPTTAFELQRQRAVMEGW